MKQKNIILIIFFLVLVWFLYLERSILTPFIVAAIFAYVFNPLVSFFYSKFKLPKAITIFFIYFFIVALVFLFITIIARQISVESFNLNNIIQKNLKATRESIFYFPDFIKPVAYDLTNSFIKSKFVNFFQFTYKNIIFAKAISEVISFFIFVFAGFYFLKDGESGIEKIINFFPEKISLEIKNILSKINVILSDYLRGEVILIFLVAFTLYISLSVIGEKFALMISVFSGFAEIIPVIGPITAGAVAVLIMLLTNTNNFGLNSIDASIIIVIIYFLLRQIEDYLVIPHIMSKITKLNPLIIFFAVIAGGHLAGIIGLILAIPLTAILRILAVFFLEKNPLGKE